MDEVVAQILRPGTIALAVAVFIFTFFVRRIVETLVPSLKKRTDEGVAPFASKFSMWWNEVILYAIPVVAGALCGLIRSEFLFGTIKELGGRLLFGAVVGWLSGFAYKVLRKAILKQTGVDIDPGAVPPPEQPTPPEELPPP